MLTHKSIRIGSKKLIRQESNHEGQKYQNLDYKGVFHETNEYLTTTLLYFSCSYLPIYVCPIFVTTRKPPIASNRAAILMAELENPHVIPKVITFLSSLLKRVADANDSNRGLGPQRISVFHGLTRPTISIQSYLERIFKYANCSPSCYVVAYVYLDRFAQSQPSLPINSFNVHRFIITSIMVAAKFMDDM